MMRWHPLRDRRGSAAIEFAVAAPTVLIVFLAVFEVYRLFAAQRALDFAVTRALREASVTSATASSSSIQSIVTGLVQDLIGSSTVSVTVTFSPSYSPGGTLTISANYNWSPAILPVDFSPVQLTSTGAITVQN